MRPKMLMNVVIAIALFASGVAVGQRTPASKFDKYFHPSLRTEMDSLALETTVDLILGSLPYRNGLSIPKTVFDYKQNRVQAWALSSSDFEKAPIETVKAEIIALYRLELVHLKASIPELSEDDFVLSVNRDSNFQPFAECKHGNIVFH